MSFATETKQLRTSLKEQGFLQHTWSTTKRQLWLKPLDLETLVFVYVSFYEHRQGGNFCYLIASPPKLNGDDWQSNPLAYGIQIGEGYDQTDHFYDRCISRLENLLPSFSHLKEVVIAEMQHPSRITIAGIYPEEVAQKSIAMLSAFRLLQQEPDFAELCVRSKEVWRKEKKIYWIEDTLAQKCIAPYADEVMLTHIEDYTYTLSNILATYSVFK